RSKTLLTEYLNRNKVNAFIDRRLGEKDKEADQGTKDDLRRVEHLRRTSTKHTLYNLSDETEVLTHGGVPITEETLKARDYDDELHEDGMLDAQFVKKQHFGGASLYADADVPVEERKYKCQKDKIDEIVAESKMRKLQAKQDQESQRKKVEVLDSQFKNFMEMMKGNLITHDDKKKAKREDPMRDYDRLMHHIAADGGPRACPSERLKTHEEIVKEKKEELDRLEADRLRRMKGEHEDERPKVFTRSADSLDSSVMRQLDERPMVAYKNGELLVLNTEGKPVTLDGARPAKKPTKEERRKRRKQQKMEKKMRQEEKKLLDDYLPSDHDDDDGSDDDDFSDDHDDVSDDHDSDGAEEHEGAEDHEAEEGITDEEEEESDADDSHEEGEEESDEEDKYSDILENEEEEEESDDDVDAEKENKKMADISRSKDGSDVSTSGSPRINKSEKLSKKDSKIKRVSFSIDTTPESEDTRARRLQEEACKELPYTLEVPADYGQFWEAMQGRTPDEVSTLVDRMVATNHPQLKHANVLKCSHIFTYVLQGNTTNDRHGRAVEGFLSATDFCLLNSGAPTRCHVQSNTFSAIGLSLCSPDVFRIPSGPLLKNVAGKTSWQRCVSSLKTDTPMAKNRGTIDALVRLQNYLVANLDERCQMLCVFFDLHKAYDTAWRETHLAKLDSVQHTALRLCTGAFRTSPTLSARRLLLSLQYLVRLEQLPPEPPDGGVLCRLRIGHTRIMYSYLMELLPQALCQQCRVLLTVPHFLAVCHRMQVSGARVFLDCAVTTLMQCWVAYWRNLSKPPSMSMH
ncbi:Nucleolar protein 14, partial [Trinorchestia longiramus]